MMCKTCNWYMQATEGVFEGIEQNDRCHNDKSGHHIVGIRSEPRIIFYTCETMLKSLCENHKLWQPRLEVA